MRRLPVERHLTANQARAEYRACRHPIEKVRWHALWLLLRADESRTGDRHEGGKRDRHPEGKRAVV
jgi:hypothetical protein